MKLFKNKNRGPKVKREDVVIPEEYLEYERLSEEKRHRDAAETSMEIEPAETTQDKVLSDELMSHFVTEDSSAEKEAQPLVEESQAREKRKHWVFRCREKSVNTQEEKTAAVSTVEADANDAAHGTRTRKHRPSWRALGLGVLILIVAGGTACLLSPLMAIDSVTVNGVKSLDEAQVLEMAGEPEGRNVFLYRAGSAQKAISLYPYVKSVEIHRHLPHSLEITIEEREPAGLLLDNGNYLQFSKDGILLDNSGTLRGRPLPIITGFSMKDIPAPGDHFKDDDRFKDALAVINACTDDLLSMLQEINIEDRQNILAYTSQGIEIRLGSIDNINARMASLNDIMNQVILSGTIEEPIEAIDIRYEKAPVIVLEGYDNVQINPEDLDKNGSAKQAEESDASSSSKTGTGDSQSSQSGGADAEKMETVQNAANTGSAETGVPDTATGGATTVG